MSVASRRRFLLGSALAAVSPCAVGASPTEEAGDEVCRLREVFARRHGLAPEWVAAYSSVEDAVHYAVLAFTSPTRGLVGESEAVRRAARVSGARVGVREELHGVGMIYLGAGIGRAELVQVMAAKARSTVVVVVGSAVELVEGELVTMQRVGGCGVVVGRPDLLEQIAAFGSGVVAGAGVARRWLEEGGQDEGGRNAG